MIRSFNRTISRIIILGLVLFFGSCGSDNSHNYQKDKQEEVSDSAGIVKNTVPDRTVDSVTAYVFTSDGASRVPFGELESEIEKLAAPFIPWVNQIRNVDFLFMYGALYFPVNTIGLGKIIGGPYGPVIEYPEKNMFFSRRTLGSICRQDDHIVLHFYGDRVFSKDPVTGGPPLVSYSLEADLYSEISLPSGRAPGEELVEAFFCEDEWLLSWKNTRDDEVSFRRQTYSPSTGISVSLGSEEYQQKLFPLSLKDFPGIEADLFNEYREEEGTDGQVYLINWQFRQEGRGITFYSGNPDSLITGEKDLIVLYGLSTSSRSFLLDGNEGYLWSLPVNKRLILPKLPPNCVYTGFSVFGSSLILSWEEQSFPFVGASGLILMEI